VGGRRAQVWVHVAYEGLGGFRAPLEDAGYAIETVDASIADFDAVDAADLLVVLGGPMGVYEQQDHPWLAREVAALGARIDAGAPVLGVCLGAQLVAAALGARVGPGAAKEIGFAPVQLSPAGEQSPLRHLAGVPLLHWHGDTFDLPRGTERLASTSLYGNQAFRRGATLLALQFHPEMGMPGDSFDAWLAGSADYVAAGGTSPERLAADHARLGPAAAAAGQAMLAEWLAGLP